jgi:peptidyl-prolyl cis-trans isomerase D
MLSSLRKFSETLIAKIFISLIALSFVFWGINGFFKSNYNNSIAEINGEEISFNNFLLEFDNVMRINNVTNKKTAIEKNIHIVAISNIISEKLLKIHAKKSGVIINDETIIIEIKNAPEFKDNQNFSRTKYEKFLLERNINSKIIEDQITKNLKRKIIIESVSGYIPINNKNSENLIKNKINSLYENSLSKIYKIIIHEKRLNDYLKNV